MEKSNQSILQNFSFCCPRKEVIQLWINMRVSKLHNFHHFGVNFSFKAFLEDAQRRNYVIFCFCNPRMINGAILHLLTQN